MTPSRLGHLSHVGLVRFCSENRSGYRIIFSQGLSSRNWLGFATPNELQGMLWFVENSTTQEHIQGFLHICVARYLLVNHRSTLKEMFESGEGYQTLDREIFEEWVARICQGSVEGILPLLLNVMEERGWQTDLSHFGDLNQRLHINS